MLLEHQVSQYLSLNYKKQILSQIPSSYNPQSIVLNITLKLDLSKILRTNRQMGTIIISQFPSFQAHSKTSINNFMEQEGLTRPQYGINLVIKITNCPLPIQNIRSAEFQLASFQQKEGIMVYLKDLLVVDITQQQMYLLSATEVWSAKCLCNISKSITRRQINKSLLNIIQQNVRNDQKQKLKNTLQAQPIKCQKCDKNYSFVERQNQIFINCQKIRCILPRRSQKQAIFQNRQFVAYGQLSPDANQRELKPGCIMSCCAYVFYRPVVTKVQPKQVIGVKSQYSAFLINTQIHSSQDNLLTIRPENSEFFYSISSIGLTQKHCRSLTDTQTLLYNYEKIVQSVDKFRFAFLPSSMLTTLKLSLLNSVCNHHANKNLHLCLTTQDIQLALRIMYISGLDIKRWPSDYDNITIINWLKSCRGCIIIVLCPNKKDIQILQQFFTNKIQGFQNISITFWLLCETTPKKQINIDYFGIVLDLTIQKNINICKQAIEQSIDLKLTAFVSQQFDSCPITIAKPKNIKARVELIQRRQVKISQAQKQMQQQESKKILQRYYLKCRDLRKTSPTTLSYLYKLAKGFAYFRSALNAEDWLTRQTNMSIIDSVMAIFLDEQSARNKFSSSNTIFGIEISKFILNQQECQISFWDYISQEDGTFTECKNYMSKSDMFKKMIYKLNELLFQGDDNDPFLPDQ